MNSTVRNSKIKKLLFQVRVKGTDSDVTWLCRLRLRLSIFNKHENTTEMAIHGSL